MVLKTARFCTKRLVRFGIQLIGASLELIWDRHTDFGET